MASASRDTQKIVRIMKDNSLHAYLATCDGDQPRVRPVSPIVEDDMTVSVTTFAGSRKVEQIRENPKVSLAFVEQPRGDKSAILVGRARIVEDVEAKKRVWGLATFDLSQHFPDGPESDEFCLLKIDLDEVEWWESWTGGRRVYVPEADVQSGRDESPGG